MNSDEVFNSNLNELIKLSSIKVDRYEYALKNSKISCMIYKTINKKTIEFPVSNLITNIDPLEKINKFFFQYMKSKLTEHYEVFSPLIDSINFKLVIELNNNQEVIKLYYKTAFFTKKSNTVIRIFPHDTSYFDELTNKTILTLEKSKHKIIKTLFGVTLDNDFIFDKNGITLIEMMSI